MKPDKSAVFCQLKHTKTQKRVYYILSNDLCKLIEIQIYGRKKHPFTGYPAAKHQKHSKFAIANIREKPLNFFYCLTLASTLVSTIGTFANSGSFAKVSVPVHIYNSLVLATKQSKMLLSFHFSIVYNSLTRLTMT